MTEHNVLLETGDSGILWFALLTASFCIAVFAPMVGMVAVSSLAQYVLRHWGGKLVVGTIERVSLSHVTVVYSTDGGQSSFRTSLPSVARGKDSQEGQEVTLLIPHGLPRRPLIWRKPGRALGLSVACLLVFWFLNPVRWVQVQGIDVAAIQAWLFFIIAGILVLFKGSEKRSTGNATTIVTASSPTAPCIEMTTTTNYTNADVEVAEQECNQRNGVDAYGRIGEGSFETNFLVALASMR
jgi:hypothetical protein